MKKRIAVALVTAVTLAWTLAAPSAPEIGPWPHPCNPICFDAS